MNNTIEIPSKWPWILKSVWTTTWSIFSKGLWIAWMWKVLGSSEEWLWNKLLDWLSVPLDIKSAVDDTSDKVEYAMKVADKWWNTTYNEMQEWVELFFTPLWEYIKNVSNNLWIDLFDNNFVENIESNPEILDTLIALVATWGVYVYLIPALLAIFVYKDRPDLSQRLRSKMFKNKSK